VYSPGKVGWVAMRWKDAVPTGGEITGASDAFQRRDGGAATNDAPGWTCRCG
jgi:hypothetical protein